MGWELTLLIFIVGILSLLLLGMPVALGFLTINLIGTYIFMGGTLGLSQMAIPIMSSIKSWSFLPIPLFILLGELLFRSGIAGRAINVTDIFFGRMPGRLGIVGVVSACLMGSFTGSSMATTSVLLSTLLPEMENRGYKTPMSLGPIIGAGGLAMMIPPSTLAVLLATLARASIGQLLMAGFIPGLLMGSLYLSYIIIRSWLQPSLAPAYSIQHMTLSKKLWLVVRDLVPIGLIVFLVSGVIFFGIATPSEAAATGTVGAIVVIALYKQLTLKTIKMALLRSAKISIMLFTIVMGSVSFSYVLSFSGVNKSLILWVTSLSVHPIIILFSLQFILFFMGMFIETTSIIMITIPMYMPIIQALGFNPLWFLVIFMINMEMAESTPPFGVLLFVVKGILPRTPMKDIMLSAVPFLVCDAIAIAMIMLFPKIALWLPSIMLLSR
ncbi:C4-dicarboxylate TRAP transporter large permease protein DctM [subsurface metagenome]